MEKTDQPFSGNIARLADAATTSTLPASRTTAAMTGVSHPMLPAKTGAAAHMVQCLFFAAARRLPTFGAFIAS